MPSFNDSYEEKKPKLEMPKVRVLEPGEEVPFIPMKQKRIVSVKAIPPGKNKCNAPIIKKDGYCDHSSQGEGNRCWIHKQSTVPGDTINAEAKELFKGALTVNEAENLEHLILDSESMTGEIGVQKIELINDLKKARYFEDLYTKAINDKKDIEYPDADLFTDPNSGELDRDTFKEACAAYGLRVEEHRKYLAEVKEAYQDVSKRIQTMLKDIAQSVEKNNKVIHGKKYTINIQQITEMLHFQVGVLEEYCKGCPKLKNIAMEFKNMKLKGIGNIEDITRMVNKQQEVMEPSILGKLRRENYKLKVRQSELEIGNIMNDMDDDISIVD